jgi:lipopolysaccharide/colanic/teichoic acid biosynthesis glycosyltransferase
MAQSYQVEDLHTADPANDLAPAFQFDRAAKRALDIVAATAGLILFSPTFLLAAIAIKIDSRGPVFRWEMLHDHNAVQIPILKFRTTMVSDTGKSISFVTRVGGAVRRTGIESLPQLINILRGEMSIVGPSPYVVPPNETFAEQMSCIQRRHGVKPGITGWAQVNDCCGDKVTQRRIEFDRHYIDNWSFLFDMKIILMTLLSKNAY